MSADSYGIIVEGDCDSVVYDALIRRLTSETVYIKPLVCRGKPSLIRKFSDLLWAFQHEVADGPVDVAIVIWDSNGRDPDKFEAEMKARIVGREYPFRSEVALCAVRHAMDAWLLADVEAINTAAQRRGGQRITRSYDRPENLHDPKSWLRKLLNDHGVTYTPQLCREIAQTTNLQILEERCPSFPSFR